MKIPKHYIFGAGLSLALVSAALGQPSYTTTPIPSSSPDAFDNFVWISDDGQVAFGQASVLAADGTRTQPCVIYQNGTYTNLPTPGFTCAAARGNSNGAFTGTLTGPGPTPTTTRFEAFVYQNGTFTLIPAPPPDQSVLSFGRGINAQGDVSGYIEQPSGKTVPITNPDGSTTPFAITETFAFVYSAGHIQRLDDLYISGSGLGFSQAEGINSDGDVTGVSAAQGGFHAALWPHGGGVVDLGVLPGDSGSHGAVINSKGQVAGVSTPPGIGANPSTVSHAFFYDNGQMTQISLPGDYAMVASMNDNGEVLVSAADSSQGPAHDPFAQRPFYYKDGQSFDLNTLATDLPQGVELKYPVWINNAGQILVVGRTQSGNPVNYLLTPTGQNEPANRKGRHPISSHQ